MAKYNYMTTIAIDTNRRAIHFYSMAGNDKSSIVHNIKNYTGAKLDESFFEEFKSAVKEFVANTPSDSIRKVTVILPDSAVLTDTVKIPTVKGSAQAQKMLDVTLGGIYKNIGELHIIAQMADQNKQYTTIGISAVQNKIVSAIYSACSENKLLVDTLTFASASSIASATQFNSKLKGESYVFLDIKNGYSRYVFVVDGKVMGYYSLPFGIELLRYPQVVQDDMLFDHSYAELILLNAREKAKSQKITVMPFGENSSRPYAQGYLGMYMPADTRQPESANEGSEVATDDVSSSEESLEDEQAQQLYLKKSNRNIPKFMLRDIPETEEGVAYENFRIFVKWALNLIQNNQRITELGKPEFVCVNLPEDLAGVIDMTNQESGENGITFTRLSCPEQNSRVSANLELYGGLFPGQINSTNKF